MNSKACRINGRLLSFAVVETTTDYVGGGEKALAMKREKTPFGVE